MLNGITNYINFYKLFKTIKMTKKELQQEISVLKARDISLTRELEEITLEAEGYSNLECVTQTILDNTRLEQEDLIKKAVISDRANLRDTISQISLWNFKRIKNQLLELCK